MSNPMALAAGARLGPYEVVGLIGVGGMGEVYRARDTRLDRTVAVKVLPSDISSDPDRRARFEREARTIATLSHSHICTLYDVGEHASSLFLVMEYLTGETLADRLRKGALPIEQALEYGAQIADALSAAHRSGVIHRDLKPANVMLTKSGVKLLDFGLAKLWAHAGELGASAMTHTRPLTGETTILGTLPYMSPEQLEGKQTDARSDVFALGLVLYEMVTGQRAFQGSSPASLIAAVLEKDPAPIAQVQPLTPPGLERVVRKCLQKDPATRWQSAWDVADELRWIASGSGDSATTGKTTARTRRRPAWSEIALALGAGLTFGVIAGAVLWRGVGSPTVGPGGVEHLAIPISTGHLTLVGGGLAISPDGRIVVFSASENSNTPRLYVREMYGGDTRFPQPRAIEGTENAQYPFISPDGQHVAFAAKGSLWRTPVSGGQVQKICDAHPHGGEWLADDSIVFGGGYRQPGIWRVSAEGGTPQLLFQPSRGSGIASYNSPQVLPGGNGILFTTQQKEGHLALRVWSTEQGERLLIDRASYGRFLPPGYLVYGFGNDLRVGSFDVGRLEIHGTSRVVAEIVPDSAMRATWELSRTGTVVYYPTYTGLARLVWKGRDGSTTPLAYKPRRYESFSLSPDGERLVAGVDEGAVRRLWIGSIDGEPLTPLTQGPDDVFNTFSPDGKWVAFTRNVNGHYNIFRVNADGTGTAEQLAVSDEAQGQPEIHPSGSTIAFNFARPTGGHIWQKPLNPEGPLQPMVDTLGVKREWFPRFSPDGRWLAYMSDASGITEVYVQELPSGKRIQLSVDGGVYPVWNPRGGELFYWAGRSLMAVRFADGRRGRVDRLFDDESGSVTLGGERGEPGFEVDMRGSRFLMLQPIESAAFPSQLYVVRNWLQELTSKVTAK